MLEPNGYAMDILVEMGSIILTATAIIFIILISICVYFSPR